MLKAVETLKNASDPADKKEDPVSPPSPPDGYSEQSNIETVTLKPFTKSLRNPNPFGGSEKPTQAQIDVLLSQNRDTEG